MPAKPPSPEYKSSIVFNVPSSLGAGPATRRKKEALEPGWAGRSGVLIAHDRGRILWAGLAPIR